MLKTTNYATTWNDIHSGAHPFLKMHGLSNHFVIVDGRVEQYQPLREEIERLCDSRIGVGADELVVVESPTAKGLAHGAYARVRIYNVDGREVEANGNATRCVAYLLLEESGRESVNLETLAGLLPCTREGVLSASVNMGPISMCWKDIPMTTAMETLHAPLESGPLQDAALLNIGNPHAVFFALSIDEIDLARFAPPIQKHSLFPQEVNVGIAQVLRTHLFAFLYGRGQEYLRNRAEAERAWPRMQHAHADWSMSTVLVSKCSRDGLRSF